MTPTTDFLTLLENLPGSYGGPTRAEPGPYAVVGTGEGTLAAVLLEALGCARPLALIACAMVVLALRAGSMVLGWRLPTYRARPPRR